ncbi:MAG: hypothetical protein AB8C02_02000 [Halioglobus sp.]
MALQANIPARFNGPPGSGNGGYSCGVLAAHVKENSVRIRLHVPPPLDKPLRVVVAEDGSAKMFDADILVGTATPAALSMDIPAPPTVAQAKLAMTQYAGKVDHAFPTCFVCGPGRPAHDGLELYPGPVQDHTLLACVWEPRADTLDSTGHVLQEIVWAALDCPGYFAAMEGTLRPALLGELLGELRAPIPASGPLLVYSWPLGNEGRKYYGGTAITNVAGDVLASSYSTWIELRT